MHSLGIVQWNSTRWDHPGNPERVSGSGLVKRFDERASKLHIEGNEIKAYDKRITLMETQPS